MAELKKEITLLGLTMVAIGSCIGSGIFVTPGQIAQSLPNAYWVLIVWALGGLIALTGALTFAELGGLFPKAGGVYVFLKEAYGKPVGFLYGWVYLLVVNTGALAALSIAFTEYLTFFFEMTEGVKITVGIISIFLLTGMNMLGVNLGQLFINTFTSLKLMAIAAIVVAGLAFFHNEAVEFNFSQPEQPANLFSALFVALIGVLWSFGGWHHASFLAGETKNATRNVPRAMIIGALIVTVTYLLVNLAYFLLLPLDAISSSERVAGDAINTLIPFGGKLVASGIAISIFGTVAIYTMSAPRVYFAMARDGVFFKQLAYVHPKFGTPVFAMALQAVWAAALILLWKTFSNLITYVTFMDLLFMMLAGISIFIFRRSRPRADRPYRTLFYPIVPAIFVIVTLIFVINTLIEKPAQAWAGLLMTAIGMGVYFVFTYVNRKA